MGDVKFFTGEATSESGLGGGLAGVVLELGADRKVLSGVVFTLFT